MAKLEASTSRLIQEISLKSPELDPCTRSNYSQFQINTTELRLSVDFKTKTIRGVVTYNLSSHKEAEEVVLDCKDISVHRVEVDSSLVEFKISDAVPIYGSALHIPLNRDDSTGEKEKAMVVSIEFETTDKCTAIQFIQGDTGPYVFSQCQAIHARTLFPCFDTPAVKSPYKFVAKSPYKVTMSGRPVESSPTKSGANTYTFDQPIPIPSYLVSITSGNLLKAPIGPRSDVYSEEPLLAQCQWEFEKDMEGFLQIAESLVFEYEWQRFDSLVLPSSFPYGGMEIPNMTQLTPTLICGDRSQVKVMAHELAHSWSGNLVTNCSWEHFWLNEGWTVYLERRILGAIARKEALAQGNASEEEASRYGEQVRHFNMIGGWNALVETCNNFDPVFTKLVVDLHGKDPDDAFSRIPYEKGFFFLYFLEQKLGGLKEFDPFVKFYFGKFRYQSLNSAQFVQALYEFYEPLGKKSVLDSIDWNKRLFESGLPEEPQLDTSLADEVFAYGDKWVDYVKLGGGGGEKGNVDSVPFKDSDIESFQGEQVMLLLEYLFGQFKPVSVSPQLIKTLPQIYPSLANSQNGEIKSRWNDILITYGQYTPEDSVVQDFADWIGRTGRMKYARPGYKLLKNGISRDYAVDVFKQHESFYHPICKTMIEKDLDLV
ncbi:uncharacterized protein LODBEIA_P07640 [Lodderomyces beijingensis]|uniref:Leukotriene A(4) hydrolase n=1 Tax=Lodderomyces beijingensis TaxID=1775926 RepID=A0ABP0ZJR7_9ASCO